MEQVPIDAADILTEEAQDSSNRCHIVVNVNRRTHKFVKDICEKSSACSQAN